MRTSVSNVRTEGQDIYVGRPSKFGNPFSHILGYGQVNVPTREEAVAMHMAWLPTQPRLLNELWSLRGKRLGCWCAPGLCHATGLAWCADKTERCVVCTVEDKTCVACGTDDVLTVAVTGHRPHKLPDEPTGSFRDNPTRKAVRARLSSVLWGLRLAYPRTKIVAMSGMAEGVDQDFAAVAVRSGFPLFCAVPFPGQEERWRPEEKQVLYHKMLAAATKVHHVSLVRPRSRDEARQMLLDRYRWMVPRCDILVGVWNGTGGGTAHCLSVAAATGKEPMIFSPQEAVDFRYPSPKEFADAYARKEDVLGLSALRLDKSRLRQADQTDVPQQA